jgi:hypothetical protein
VQGLRLDLLALEVGAGVVEVEEHAALVQFLDKQLRTLGRRCL